MKFATIFELLHFGRWLTRNGYKYQRINKRWIKEGAFMKVVTESEIMIEYEATYKNLKK